MKVITFCSSCVILMVSSQVWGKTNDMACTGIKSAPGFVVEMISEDCKNGDAIVTKFPALYCDFKSTIVKGDGASYYCIYIGKPRKLRPFDLSKLTENGK
jgi:hypothetical protein